MVLSPLCTLNNNSQFVTSSIFRRCNDPSLISSGAYITNMFCLNNQHFDVENGACIQRGLGGKEHAERRSTDNLRAAQVPVLVHSQNNHSSFASAHTHTHTRQHFHAEHLVGGIHVSQPCSLQEWKCNQRHISPRRNAEIFRLGVPKSFPFCRILPWSSFRWVSLFNLARLTLLMFLPFFPAFASASLEMSWWLLDSTAPHIKIRAVF